MRKGVRGGSPEGRLGDIGTLVCAHARCGLRCGVCAACMAGARVAAYPYAEYIAANCCPERGYLRLLGFCSGRLYAPSERRPAYGDCGTSVPSTMLCAKSPMKSLDHGKGRELRPTMLLLRPTVLLLLLLQGSEGAAAHRHVSLFTRISRAAATTSAETTFLLLPRACGWVGVRARAGARS